MMSQYIDLPTNFSREHGDSLRLRGLLSELSKKTLLIRRGEVVVGRAINLRVDLQDSFWVKCDVEFFTNPRRVYEVVESFDYDGADTPIIIRG